MSTRTQPIEEHQVHSLRLMAHAEEQLDAGDRIQASEKAWGAVAHQLKVVADRRGWQYETHSDSHRVARRLSIELADPEIHILFRVATALHDNFYSDTIPIESLRLDIEAIKRLMVKLRDAAAQ